MFHKFIHNDNGIDCYRCGMSVDFPWLPVDDEIVVSDEETIRQQEEEIRFFLPNCAGPTEGRGHHFFVIGNADNEDSEHIVGAVECHYGDAHIGWETDLAYVPRFCKGD